MGQIEGGTEYFMLRIWGEEIRRYDKQTKLRGYITHIPSRHHSYFEDLSDILAFVEPYLEKLGIENASE